MALKRLPLALAVHEALGLSLMVGSFGLCYCLRVGHCVERLLPNAAFASRLHDRLAEALQKLEGKAWVQRWLSPRGVQAFAESILLRLLFKPILVPLKLWATYKCLQCLP